jgi:hypothetical protein
VRVNGLDDFFVTFVGERFWNTGVQWRRPGYVCWIVANFNRIGFVVESWIQANTGRIGPGNEPGMFIWPIRNYENVAGLRFDRNRKAKNRVRTRIQSCGRRVANTWNQRPRVGASYSVGWPGPESVSWGVAGQIGGELGGPDRSGPCDPTR